MKNKYFGYFLLIFVNIAVAFSCFYYPVSRDEFYYLEKVNFPNVFAEYYHSYFYVNARIGQFFCNLISRSAWLEVIFGLLLFNGFFITLFLNYYRRLPDFSIGKEVFQFLGFTGFFIFTVSYFGEMFYYTPFSTNYTLSHIFYLLTVYVLAEYFIYRNHQVLKKISYLLLIILGVFTGMSNEHVPPVLLFAATIGGLHYIFKNKKLPDYKLIAYCLSLFCGYLLLFFSPANKVKEATVKKSPFDISFPEYLENLARIFKFYFYYNFELIVISAIAVIFVAVNYKKLILEKVEKYCLCFYLFLAVSAVLIVGISPLVGMRLLFFSTILIIMIVFRFISITIRNYQKLQEILLSFSFLWLFLFFGCSMYVTFSANAEYHRVMNDIFEQSKTTKNVVLHEELNYETKNLKNFNRRILLENGTSYIDNNPLQNTAQEKNLIQYFNLKNLSHP